MFPTLTLETIFLQEFTVRSKQLKPMVPKWVYSQNILTMFAAGVLKLRKFHPPPGSLLTQPGIFDDFVKKMIN